jgi:hypothetical protein
VSATEKKLLELSAEYLAHREDAVRHEYIRLHREWVAQGCP